MDLTKEFERLAKLKERKAAVLDPSKRVSGGGIKSGLTELERLQKAKEKLRRDFVTEVLEKKNVALNEYCEDYPRLVKNVPVTERGIEQAQEVYASYRETKAHLEAQLYLLEKKMEAADSDLNVLHAALDNFRCFEAAVKSYALSCVEENEMFEVEEVIYLWEDTMTFQDIEALNRGTTTFNSIDYLFKSIEDEFANNPDAAREALEEKIDTLFSRYDIKSFPAPSEDI